MTAREFRKYLNNLRYVDKSDLVKAGVIKETENKKWEQFRVDPFRYALGFFTPEEFAILFGLIQQK